MRLVLPRMVAYMLCTAVSVLPSCGGDGAAVVCPVCPVCAECDCQVRGDAEGADVCDGGAAAAGALDAELRAALENQIREELRSELRATLEVEVRAELRAALEQSIRDEVRARAEAELAASKTRPGWPPDVRVLRPTGIVERDAGGMKVLRHVLADNVRHRQPEGDGEVFGVSEKSVFCYVEISVPGDDDREVTMRFTHSTGLGQSYVLPVGQSPAWRTWAKLNLTKSMVGAWLCEVFNEDDVLMSSRPFVVVD